MRLSSSTLLVVAAVCGFHYDAVGFTLPPDAREDACPNVNVGGCRGQYISLVAPMLYKGN